MDPETLKILQSIIVAIAGAVGYKFMLGGKKEDSHVSDNKTITELFNIQAKSIEDLNKTISEQSKKIDEQSKKIDEQSDVILQQQEKIKDLTDQVLILNAKIGVYEKGDNPV